jgi:hypothetical protein
MVKFAFSWWNTLPLSMGLLLWAICVVAVARAALRFPAAVALLVAGPALLLVLYWGAYATGLMRECGQPLFAAILGVACLELARSRGALASLLSHPIFPWLQLPETLLMLWLTTLLNPHRPPGNAGLLDGLYLAIGVLALAGAAYILSMARRRLPSGGAPAMPAA